MAGRTEITEVTHIAHHLARRRLADADGVRSVRVPLRTRVPSGRLVVDRSRAAA